MHPAIVMRHLKTVAAVLKAKSGEKAEELVSSGRYVLWAFVIDIMTTLRPIIFEVRC
jgi:hypothetical protein